MGQYMRPSHGFTRGSRTCFPFLAAASSAPEGGDRAVRAPPVAAPFPEGGERVVRAPAAAAPSLNGNILIFLKDIPQINPLWRKGELDGSRDVVMAAVYPTLHEREGGTAY